MRFGVVIQWASAFFELRKKVSGIQIFPTMLLLRRRTFIVLLNFNRLSYQVWAKKMSMVYSWTQIKDTFTRIVMLNFKIWTLCNTLVPVCQGNLASSIVCSQCCHQCVALKREMQWDQIEMWAAMAPLCFLCFLCQWKLEAGTHSQGRFTQTRWCLFRPSPFVPNKEHC